MEVLMDHDSNAGRRRCRLYFLFALEVGDAFYTLYIFIFQTQTIWMLLSEQR